MSGLGHGQSSWLYSSKASAAGPNSFLRCAYTHSGRIQKNQGPNWDSGSYFPWLPPGSIPLDPVPAWTPSSFRPTPCLHDFQQHPLASGSLCTSCCFLCLATDCAVFFVQNPYHLQGTPPQTPSLSSSRRWAKFSLPGALCYPTQDSISVSLRWLIIAYSYACLPPFNCELPEGRDLVCITKHPASSSVPGTQEAFKCLRNEWIAFALVHSFNKYLLSSYLGSVLWYSHLRVSIYQHTQAPNYALISYTRGMFTGTRSRDRVRIYKHQSWQMQ